METKTNKFATMLHRNTNRITIILIYTVLEWILILLLLLNALFSHLIIQFAVYFGLKRPCLWCSRVDHCFGITKSKNIDQDLVCDSHANEISQLGYCSEHKKLARNLYMCKDCSFSQPFSPRSSADVGRKIAFLSCVGDKAETNSKCSCCDASLTSDLYPPYLDFNSNREVEDEDKEEEHVDEGQGVQRNEENCLGSPLSFECKEIEINEDDMADTAEKESIKVHAPDSPNEGMIILQSSEDNLIDLNPPLKLENWSNFDDHFLVTLEPIHSLTLYKGNLSGAGEVNHGQSGELENLLDSDLQVQKQVNSVEDTPLASKLETIIELAEDENNTRCAVQDIEFDVWEPQLEYMNKTETKNSLVMPSEDYNSNSDHQVSNDNYVEAIELAIKDSDEATGIELAKTMIEREVSDQELNDQPQPHDPMASLLCLQDDSSRNYTEAENTTSTTTLVAEEDQSLEKTEEVSVEERTLSIERIKEEYRDDSSSKVEANGGEEYCSTEVPNHIEDLQSLHKKKDSVMEESLDGSFISEVGSGEGSLTTEHLKMVLKEERKARCALYEELEEERCANAIAAKQTMEMITRLQEEKATMRMEALQYQRMMDEQSEYDQEALQLLNELVVKVEKEKNELQMELEICRKKVLHYEAKERRMMKRKSGDLNRTYSASFSNSEDSDQLPVDFDHESVDEDSCNGHPESSNNTPANGVLHLEDTELENSKHMSVLDESLADFEAEKLSILEKLKELEEKLFTLSDEEGEYYEDIKPVVLFPDETKENEDFNDQDISSNGFLNEMENPEENGFHSDSNGVETLDVRPNGKQSMTPVSNFKSANKRLAIEEEVDNVYERLQALEADREFLKQSISSLKKGDKGMDLLQEILQYLRDLRSVELCTRKMNDT